MNENTTKIVAVVVVLVLVVAGIAAFMIFNNGSGKGANIDAALEVYGNADNDYKIDEADKTVINKIIKGEDGYTLAKYPLADANFDGKVNEDDLEQVNAIIKGYSTTVYHLNHTTDTTTYPSGTYVASTKWPVSKTIANGAANALIMYQITGIKNNIVGINYSSGSPPDKIIWPDYAAMPSLGSSTMYIDETPLVECLEANPGTTCVLTADNKGYLDGKKGLSEKELEERYNLDVVRLEHATPDPDDYCSALLLIGFLFQKETAAQEVAEWTTKVYKDLAKKTDKVTDKVKATGTAYYTYLSGPSSDYTAYLTQAGAVYPIWSDAGSTIYFDQSDSRYDPRVYEDQYQGDVIIAYRTGSGFLKASWYDDSANWNAEEMQKQLGYFKNFKAYESKNVWHTSGDMPIVARVLYTAAILYPDLYSIEEADKLHQEFVDKFMGGIYNVSELDFVLSQADIEAM